MIFWNTAETRDAFRRALANLNLVNDGAVMQLDMVSGDLLLCMIAEQPMTEDQAYAIRFATT